MNNLLVKDFPIVKFLLTNDFSLISLLIYNSSKLFNLFIVSSKFSDTLVHKITNVLKLGNSAKYSSFNIIHLSRINSFKFLLF